MGAGIRRPREIYTIPSLLFIEVRKAVLLVLGSYRVQGASCFVPLGVRSPFDYVVDLKYTVFLCAQATIVC